MSQWESTAGPRQTKQVSEALQSLSTRGKTYTELTGVIGGEERSSCFINLFGGTSEACQEAWNRVGEKWNWAITRENYRDIIADVTAEIKALVLPVIDKRITPEQKAERDAIIAENEAKRQAEENEKSAATEKAAAELRQKYPWASSDQKLSTHARAAKNLRTELQKTFPGANFSVRSESYSGGNSIHVAWTDGPTSQQVKEVTDKYVYGSFDGMTDSYDYDHSAFGEACDRVLGRVRHLFCSREASPELEARGRQFILAEFGVVDDPSKSPWEIYLDDSHSQRHTLSTFWNEAFERQAIPRGAELIGLGEPDSGVGYTLIFSEPNPAYNVATEVPDGTTCHVEKHHHTKKDFDMWLVVLDERVERDEFERLRSECKSAGGWYSRQWGRTPGGFAFESAEVANEFAATLNGSMEIAVA